MTEGERIDATMAELRAPVEPGPTLQEEVAALREAAGPAPLFDVAELRPAFNRQTLTDLLAEKCLTLLRLAIVRWQTRCARLEAKAERLNDDLSTAKQEIDKLRQELRMAAAVRDADGRTITRVTAERDRLRDAAEHALAGCKHSLEALEWGMQK